MRAHTCVAATPLGAWVACRWRRGAPPTAATQGCWLWGLDAYATQHTSMMVTQQQRQNAPRHVGCMPLHAAAAVQAYVRDLAGDDKVVVTLTSGAKTCNLNR